MQSVTSWLAERGLQRYADALVAADVDLEILADLSENDLEKLGVSLGDRKRILRALEAAPAVVTPVATEGGEYGERRHLTVLFCDLVGSTELAGKLDPEDLRATISTYHNRCSDVVARHGGEVAQFLGDGVMAQFGFPRAHEDDAERAARCALELVRAVAELELPGGIRLQTRIGLATGTEVVGDLHGSRDRMSVVGNTPSLASRLQNVAEPQTVVITTATRRLLGDAFALVPLPSRFVKGIGDDIPLWRVDGEIRGASRFALRHAGARARFVGRDFESALLRDRWRIAKAGEGQVVLLIAEPGIGKSRIVEEFLAVDGAASETTIALQCSPHYAASALQPIRDFIERAAGIIPSDTTSSARAKLVALGQRWRLPDAENVDVLALLVELADAENVPGIRALSTEQRKALVFRSLLQLVESLARRDPMRIVVEDLHWSDPTTLDLLTQLIETVHDDRVLVVATARPEFASPWVRFGHVTSLSVNRLERVAVQTLVAEMCRGSLADDVVAQIVERTDGVPLFVEELTQSVLESAAAGGPQATIPNTLRDALTARLDALDADRETAQIGAVIGREFSADLLGAIAERDVDALRPTLDRLVESGLVRRQGSSGKNFAFKHALVRDAAYENLLRGRRQELHLRAARALAERAGAATSAEPEIVAHHFEEASHPGDALPYWRRAADAAIARSGYREAGAHLGRATQLLDRVPPDDGRTERDVRNLTGVVYGVLEGGRSETARASYERAFALCADLPEDRATFTALCGLCICDYMSGRTVIALGRSKELIAIAERLGDSDLLLEAYHTAWATGASLGDVRSALAASERAMAIYDPDRHHAHVTKFGTGHDSGVCGLGFGSQSQILSGRIAEGRTWIDRTKALVARLDHPFSKCIGLQHAAIAHAFLEEYDAALALVRESLAIAEPRKFAMPIAFSAVIAGGALIGLGRDEEGAAMIGRVLDDPLNAVPANWRPLHMAFVARTELRSGDARAARERLQRALAYASEIGGCVAEPEIHLALADAIGVDDRASARASIEYAATHARTYGATFLEMRAAVARARDLDSSDAGTVGHARAELLRILAAFEADADCEPIRTARACLETLESR